MLWIRALIFTSEIYANFFPEFFSFSLKNKKGHIAINRCMSAPIKKKKRIEVNQLL